VSTLRELEEQITRAHDRGDQEQLQRLQAEYRRTAGVIRVSGPDAIRLVESQPRRVNEDRSAFRSSVPAVRVPTTVRVRPEALDTIRNMPLELGTECGGLLVGHDDGDEIVVETCYGRKGGDFGGERDRIVFDREWLGVIDRKAQGCGWKVVGDVHSHRNSEPEPSSIDEDGWRGLADELRQNYVGLVLGPDPNRVGWAHDGLWVRPEFRAFVAPRGDNTVRPVNLILEEVY
jgi:proteasome lid subunit RPN8/RPN11